MESCPMVTHPNRSTAIVTGTSRGIGEAIASRLLNNGWRVFGVSNHTQSDNLLSERDYQQISADLSKTDEVARIVETTLESAESINVLVNCAGVITRNATLDHSVSDWGRVLQINLTAAYQLCQSALPSMMENGGGSIVNIASQMAFMPHIGASPSYEVSKAGLVALTRHLAEEFGPQGIRSNSVSPGSIATGLQNDMNSEVWQQIRSKIPMRRLGLPDEVAKVVMTLVSDAGSYINGADISVNGGSLMR